MDHLGVRDVLLDKREIAEQAFASDAVDLSLVLAALFLDGLSRLLFLVLFFRVVALAVLLEVEEDFALLLLWQRQCRARSPAEEPEALGGDTVEELPGAAEDVIPGFVMLPRIDGKDRGVVAARAPCHRRCVEELKGIARVVLFSVEEVKCPV